MWLRGGLLSMGLLTGYSSLRYLTISEFLTIFCCLPFPTGLLCWLFLGEKFTRVQMICCCKFAFHWSSISLYSGFSVLGVAMITDPFARVVIDDSASDTRLANLAINDNIPNDLKTKLIGLAMCAPSVLALAGESKSTLSPQDCKNLTSRSDDHASDQRPGFDDANPRHYLILSGIDQCPVRTTDEM